MSEHVLSILVKAIGAQKAAKDLKGVDLAVANIGGRAGKGLRTFGHNLKSAFTTPIGLLGITGGLFGLEHILSESIGKAQEFGGEVVRLMALTGQGAETTSAMAAALEHFGIGADQAQRLLGFLEKNVGNLTIKNAKAGAVIDALLKKQHGQITTQQRLAALYPKAVKFQKDYGFSILKSNGQVKNANELLLDSADFFNNKSVPAQTKAAAMAKLYGRSWQDLVPILKAGKQGISDAEEEAKRLGLTLTSKNIDALKKNKAATREWNTALGGLELQIGLKLIPYMTTLANTATSFVSEHGDEIVGFFGDAATFASQLGGAIHDDVLPVFKRLGDIWGAIPPDMKKILIAGFAVNKLSGGALTGIGGDIFKGFAKGFVKAIGITAGTATVKAGVVKVDGPVAGGGGPGGAIGAGGGAAGELAPMGLAAFLGTAAIGGAIGIVAASVEKGITDALTGPIHDLTGVSTDRINQGADTSRSQAFGGIAALADLPNTVDKMGSAVNDLSTFINSPHPDFLGDLGKLAFLQYHGPTAATPPMGPVSNGPLGEHAAAEATVSAIDRMKTRLATLLQQEHHAKSTGDDTKAHQLHAKIVELKGQIRTSEQATARAIADTKRATDAAKAAVDAAKAAQVAQIRSTGSTTEGYIRGTTGSVVTAQGAIVAAINASRPVVNVSTLVTVGANSVTHATTTQSRVGSVGGSRSRRGNGGASTPT